MAATIKEEKHQKEENMKNQMRLFYVFAFSAIVVLITCVGVSAETGVSDTKIKIGTHLALTGPPAFAGKGLLAGMQVYFSYINEQGGIHGRKIELIAEDDGYSPTKAVAAAKKLMDRDEVFAFLGPLGGSLVKVVMPTMEENRIPYLFPSTATIEIVHPVKRYVFGFFTQFDRIFIMLTDLAVKEFKAKKISVFYPDQAVGHVIRDTVIKRLKKYGMEVVEKIPVKHTDVDFSGAVAKLKASGTDTVMIGTHIPPTIAFLKECRRQNYNPTCLQDPSGTDPLMFFLAKKPAITNGLIGATYMLPIDSDAPVVKKWREHMAKYSKARPSNYALMTYNTAWMLCDALKAAGRDLTREKLINIMESWKGYDNGLSGPITYNANDHEGGEKFFIVRAGNNKWNLVFDTRVGLQEKLVRD